MRVPFEFPAFETLQLGPNGSCEPGECGCLASRWQEVVCSADLNDDEQDKLWSALSRAVGGGASLERLVSLDCPNTFANRRKAYNALCRATDEALGVEDCE